MEKEMIQNLAWCYDVRTGWSEIENVVWAGDESDMDKALLRAGFNSEFLKLGKDSCTIEIEIYRSSHRTGPQFFVCFLSVDCVEQFYLANLPSLMAWLKDAAAIFQAGMLSDIITPVGESLLDNITSYVAGMVRATRPRGRR